MILARITLPFPPSVNSLFGGGSKQQRFHSKKYKEWLKACPYVSPWCFDRITLTYRYFFPDNRTRDAENYVKAASDFLVKARAIEDDCWACVSGGLHVLPCGIDRHNPRVEITIEDYDGQT